jgi:hypothetical protein
MPEQGAALRGIVQGGQQPIVGAHVYLFAANTTGYGGNGIAASTANASISLLNVVNTGLSDSVGAYVLTDATGSFTITGDYTCTSGQQVYLYSLGGQPTTGTANAAAGLMAVLGSCPSGGSFAGTLSYLYVNEVSTVAAAYAMAGFASDATHVSSSGTSLAQTGIANAFANANQLYDIEGSAPGQIARATTPAGNGTVPQATLDTLANILASCINTNGAVTGPTSATACYTLFYNAESGGSTGTVPTDTATAAINIAHHPGSNITALYALPGTSAPFGSALSSQPNDFTVGLNFTGGGLNTATSLAITSSGYAWVTNYQNNSVSEFSNLGAALSPSGGDAVSGLYYPQTVAIDGSGNVWVANSTSAGNHVSKLSSTGSPISSSSGYSGGGLDSPRGTAIDSSGAIWVTSYDGNNLAKFSNNGNAVSPSNGYTGGGLNQPESVAIDASGNAWAANYNNKSISKFSSGGGAISPSGGYTGAGLNSPWLIVVDSSENVWVADYYNPGAISELSNSGTAISPSGGYTGGGLNTPWSIAIDGAGNAWTANHFGSGSVSEFSSSGTALSPSTGYIGTNFYYPSSIAIDGSGDAWVANEYNSSVTELIGIATPVVTPVVANLISPYSAPASKP